MLQNIVTLDLRNASTHRVKVTIEARKGALLPALFSFPVWTPGSYMVREYSRHITGLPIGTKVDKNSWRVPANTRKISYEAYCFEPTVRTSYLDNRYAALVGATLLPILGSSFTVEIILPRGWNHVASALNFRKKGNRWVANVSDDDRWIDAPILAWRDGFGATGSFVAGRKNHKIAWVGGECARTMKELTRDFKKISDTTLKMFGGAPFKDYTFLLHFTNGGGGLEHRDSQLSQFDGAKLADKKAYESFLRLIAHEYFHAWNVKSLRPVALGPFHYFRENYTEELWFAEGITDYFDDLIPLQAGLVSKEWFLKSRLTTVTNTSDGYPAHKRRSLAESSFDAWIRAYRKDEDSDNSDVCYYDKGSLLAWCWDAHIQKKSKRRWTLGLVMKALWKEFGVDADESLAEARPGYTRDELLDFVEKITKVKQKALVESWVTGRELLPWRDAAKFFGIKYKETIADSFLHKTGASLKWPAGVNAPVVNFVASESAAEAAGLSSGDEVLAINGVRISTKEILTNATDNQFKNTKEWRLVVAKNGKVLEVPVAARSHKGLGTTLEHVK